MLYFICFFSDNFRASSVRNRSASLPAISREHESTEGAVLDINNSQVVVLLFLILIARKFAKQFPKWKLVTFIYVFVPEYKTKRNDGTGRGSYYWAACGTAQL